MQPSFIDSDGYIDFHRLYEIYYAPFCIYAKRFIADGDARQDIVQDVFVSVWKRFGGMKVEADTMLAYIKMSVRNSCLNWIDHRRHVDDFAQQTAKYEPPYADDTDSLYTLEEMYERLEHIVAAMDERQRTVFEQTIIGEKNQAEVAEQLGVSVKSVGRYRQRIMQMLKAYMKDYLAAVLLCYEIYQ